MFCGIPFSGNLQDRAMTELMTNDQDEPIYDRTKEHLSSSDAMIVTVRRQLVNAATKLRDEGKIPANVDDVDLDRVRSASLRYPAGSELEEPERNRAHHEFRVNLLRRKLASSSDRTRRRCCFDQGGLKR